MNGTTDVNLTLVGTSLKMCACCSIQTSVLCVKGACITCHSGGLCHHA